MSPRAWRSTAVAVALIYALIALLVMCLSVAAAHAEGYTASDTVAAIDAASAETGVSWTWLYRTVRCEAPGMNPYAVGRQGELGAVQLHPHGELRRFYAMGFTDPFNPYEAVTFMAYRFNAGGARAWSCA